MARVIFDIGIIFRGLLQMGKMGLKGQTNRDTASHDHFDHHEWKKIEG